MGQMTFENLSIIIGIIFASGGVVFSAFTMYNTLHERLGKIDTRVAKLENDLDNSEAQTAELMHTVKDIQENVSDIRITQTEMRVVLSGVDGKNGLRGELRELKAELKELLNKM